MDDIESHRPQRDPDGVSCVQKIVKFGGAGALVPITGFANSVVSPAIEYKAEGHVFGIGWQDLYDRGTGDPLRDPCELGAGMVKYFWRYL